MNDIVYVGTITGTHGIKGEVKIKSDFEYKDRVFYIGQKIIIENEEVIIASYRHHQQFDMITINNILDINEVYKYVGKDVFIKREYLRLQSDEFLYKDLISCEVIEEGNILGKVESLRKNNVLLLEVHNHTSFLIPFVNKYIEKVDISGKKIYTKGAKELIL